MWSELMSPACFTSSACLITAMLLSASRQEGVSGPPSDAGSKKASSQRPSYGPDQRRLLYERLDYHRSRHEQINNWRYAIVGPLMGIYVGVLVATVAAARVEALDSEEFRALVTVSLSAVALSGFFVYLRLAITRAYAANEMNRYHYYFEKLEWALCLRDLPPKPLKGRLAYVTLGSHFWSDTAIATLNSCVAAMAIWLAEAPAWDLWSPLGLGSVLLAAHLVFYVGLLSYLQWRGSVRE